MAERIAIVGSREYPGVGKILARLHHLRRSHDARKEPLPVIVSGGARGVDQLAITRARGLGFQTEVFPAEWRNGEGNLDRSAGYKRNLRVVESVDRIIAFWDGKSRGTKHTIDIALREGKDVEVIFP